MHCETVNFWNAPLYVHIFYFRKHVLIGEKLARAHFHATAPLLSRRVVLGGHRSSEDVGDAPLPESASKAA